MSRLVYYWNLLTSARDSKTEHSTDAKCRWWKKPFLLIIGLFKIIIFHNGLKISFTKNKWSFKLKFTTFLWGKQFNQQKRQRGSMKNAGKKRLLKKRHITIIVFCFCFCFLLLFSFLSCGCYFQSSSSSSSDSASSSQVSHWLT